MEEAMEIHAASYLYPVGSPPISGGAIAVLDGRIVAIGHRSELVAHYSGTVHDYPGAVIMPGLVNPHTHLELTHFPSWKIRKGLDYMPRTYMDWIVQVIKIRRGLTHDELVASLREGLRLCLESGVTAIGEIQTDYSLLPHYLSSGISGRLFFEAVGQDPKRSASLMSELSDLCTAGDMGTLLPAISPHAPHTVSGSLLTDLAALARSHSLPLMIHLEESDCESRFFLEGTGPIASVLYPLAGWEDYLPAPRHITSTAWLDSLGILAPSTTVVHGVHLTIDDIVILAKRGVTLVLCPRSNERLAVGKAPAHLFKGAGINLALGTDSLASNDSLSLWDELRALHDLYPGLFSMEESLAMVTTGAARAIGLDGRVGILAPGVRADFLLLDLAQTLPSDRLAEGIIDSGRVAALFMGGRQVCC
jgi:cytosine/adenosine deaminase-related metal-dependent hydrolase